jgi:2-keto-4-pentenoate hydratase/2-oxohepta-3-ene-1,7-dioic acid hydratase in catechol pathway
MANESLLARLRQLAWNRSQALQFCRRAFRDVLTSQAVRSPSPPDLKREVVHRIVDTAPLVLEPKRIVALGLTWRSHARETGERMSADGPAVFARDPASLATGGQVVIPSQARIRRTLDALEPGLGAELARRHPQLPALFDYEIELGFVVLADGRIGWFVANDLTVRSVQILGEGTGRRMDFWSASKSFPSSLLVGPVMVTDDDTPDVELVLRVGGEVRQRGSTTELAYGARELRRFAGVGAAGEVVLTGTPAGIALQVPRWKRVVADLLLDRWGKLGAALRSARGSRRFLQPGDVIEMDAGPLGHVRAVVEAETEDE